MKKPSEMTVGLFAAVFAVGSAMWIDTATAQDKNDQQVQTQTTAKKKKPTASQVSNGTASEPNKDPVKQTGEAAKEVDQEFREGYGGSGNAGANDGKTDATDIGRQTKNVEETTKEMGQDVGQEVKAGDKGFREGYHKEAADAPTRENAAGTGGSGERVDTEPDRTDLGDIGYEAGKATRRVEESITEAGKKITGNEGKGGSGDAGTGKIEVDLKTHPDAGTPSKVHVKLKTDAGTK